MGIYIDLKDDNKLDEFKDIPIGGIFGFFCCPCKYVKLTDKSYMNLSLCGEISYDGYASLPIIPYNCLNDEMSSNPSLIKLSSLNINSAFICPFNKDSMIIHILVWREKNISTVLRFSYTNHDEKVIPIRSDEIEDDFLVLPVKFSMNVEF